MTARMRPPTAARSHCSRRDRRSSSGNSHWLGSAGRPSHVESGSLRLIRSPWRSLLCLRLLFLMTDGIRAKPDPVNELVVLVRSRLGLIALAAADPEQAHETLTAAAAQLGIPLFFWTRTKGLRRKNVGTAVYGTTDSLAALAYIEVARIPAIYEFEGLGADLADPTRAQRLKDAITGLDGLDAAIVLLDGTDSLPEPLRQLAALVTLPAPSRADYHAVINRVVQQLHGRINVRTDLTPADLERLVGALRGFTLPEAEHILTRIIVEDGILSAQDIPRVTAAKYADMKAAGLLEFCPVDVKLDDIADLASLKSWLATRRSVVSAPGRA